MRRMLRLSVLGVLLGLGACAGAGEPPTAADAIFPLPYWFKQQRAQPLPPYSGGTLPAPTPHQ